jgi:hypothetical protein
MRDLPPCPWCLGERIHDPWLFEETHHGCAVCLTQLGLQLVPLLPAYMAPEHPLTSALDGSGSVDAPPSK